MGMQKFDPEELKEIAEEVEGIISGHHEILDKEPRILNPLKDAYVAAKNKYKDKAEIKTIE